MSTLTLHPAPRRVHVPGWAVAVVALWLGVLAIAYGLKPSGTETLCHFRRVTGVSCPTCGATRAVHHTIEGRFVDAALMNPMLTLVALGALAWLIVRLGFGRRLDVRMTTRQRVVGWTVFGVLFLANWAFVIVRDLG